MRHPVPAEKTALRVADDGRLGKQPHMGIAQHEIELGAGTGTSVRVQACGSPAMCATTSAARLVCGAASHRLPAMRHADQHARGHRQPPRRLGSGRGARVRRGRHRRHHTAPSRHPAVAHARHARFGSRNATAARCRQRIRRSCRDALQLGIRIVRIGQYRPPILRRNPSFLRIHDSYLRRTSTRSCLRPRNSRVSTAAAISSARRAISAVEQPISTCMTSGSRYSSGSLKSAARISARSPDPGGRQHRLLLGNQLVDVHGDQPLALEAARVFAAHDGQKPGFGGGFVQQRILRLPGPQHRSPEPHPRPKPVADSQKANRSKSGRSDWQSAWKRARPRISADLSFMYKSAPDLRCTYDIALRY